MFKSVFAKFVTAVMTIFVVGFAILLFVATSIVGNYNAKKKEREMENTATALHNFVEIIAAPTTPETFEYRFLETIYNPNASLSSLVSAFATKDEELTIAIANTEGKLLLIVPYLQQDEEKQSYFISAEVNTAAQNGEKTIAKCQLSYLDRAAPTRIEAIHNSAGNYCGCVLVSSTRPSGNIVMEEMTQTILSTALLVLVAAMIAVYFISNRIISPLREISIAAGRFAKGHFDTRVCVRGRDEIARLAVDFNNMADSLENLEKMRSSFVANISHDLRTPMTTISGFIDEIRSGVIPPEQQDYYLGVIETEIKRLSRLVASLLDLSRIQAGERKFVMRPFDICEMGRQILISFEQPIEEKSLQVEFDCDNEHLSVMADHDAIYQVFYNLCHNAVKFSKQEGLLRIAIKETKEHKIQVAVYNEGKGIAKDDLPFVFDRFYKSDKSRGLDKSGLGLGLFISKTIVDAHEEMIWVNSRENEFCEFFFTLKKATIDEERKRGTNE